MLILGRYLLVFFAVPSVAQAESGPPKWLVGKSIIIRYTETRSFDPVKTGFGTANEDTLDSRTNIYISDRSRIFAIGQNNIVVFTLKGQPTRSVSRIKSPDSTSQGSDWRFEGDTLYGFSSLGNSQYVSVKRIAVNFNPGSQTCTATIGYARPSGSKDNIAQGWWRGEFYYLRGHTLTSSSCEVKFGNIFDSAQ
jgi:hypothetical protein